MSYLIGIDVGTSGTKTLLVNEAGEKVASATAEYPLYMPRPLWAEQDPVDWWTATVETIRRNLDERASWRRGQASASRVRCTAPCSWTTAMR